MLGNSQWDGLPGRGEVCTQRPCCQELHVSGHRDANGTQVRLPIREMSSETSVTSQLAKYLSLCKNTIVVESASAETLFFFFKLPLV